MADLSRSTDEPLRSVTQPPPTRTLLVTVARAAEILSLSRSSIYQLIWSQQLVPIRIGRSIRFTVDQLEPVPNELLTRREVTPHPHKTSYKCSLHCGENTYTLPA